MQDPQVYLKQLGVHLMCPIYPDREAVIDAGHRTYVNHEIYFFSDLEALEQFKKHPLRWCGMLTDPVTGARLHPSEASPRFDYKGRPYFFSTPATRAAFEADPEPLANPKRKMPMKNPAG